MGMGKSFLVGTIIGGVAGATAALLLAPKAGKEIRGDISQQSIYLKEKSTDMASYAKQKSSGFAKSVTKQSTQMVGKVKKLPNYIRLGGKKGELILDNDDTNDDWIHQN